MLILYRQFLSAFLASLLCVLGVITLQFPRMQKMINRSDKISLSELQREVSAEKIRLEILKKIPAFGYDNIFANAVFLSFFQYFGDDIARQKTGYHLSPEYFEIILKHDPRFRLAYLNLSTSTSMYAAMPEKSVQITERGLQHLRPFLPKQSYYIWRYKGIDELLFLGQSQAAKKSFQSAADWAKYYSDEESKAIAAMSQTTANFLASNPNSKTAQISAWAMILQNGVDEPTSKRVIQEIEKLGGRVIQTELGAEVRFPQHD